MQDIDIDIDLISQSTELIQLHFGISRQELFSVKDENSFTDVHNRLTKVVAYLLEKDLQRLVNGLYKVDVDERKVKAAFTQEDPQQIASSIARLILERELQKCIIRRHYQQ